MSIIQLYIVKPTKAAFLILLLLHCCTGQVRAQTNFFNHLTTANGLTGNDIQCTVVDKNGFLWIGTSEGLNRYDGYTVAVFPKSRYPGLVSDNIRSLFCDAQGRVWVGTPDGLSFVDQDLGIHTVLFTKPGDHASPSIDDIIETKGCGLVLINGDKQFQLLDNDKPLLPASWKQLEWATGLINAHTGNPTDICRYRDDAYMFTGNGQVVIADYSLHKEIFRLSLDFAWTACPIKGDHEILVASQRGALFKVDLQLRQIVKSYIPYGYKKKLMTNTSIEQIRLDSSGNILIATGFAGMMVYDLERQSFTQYIHDPLSDHSLSSDKLYKIYCGEDGNIFVATLSAGLNIFNAKYYKAHGVTSFENEKGDIADGYVNDILEDKQGHTWVATEDNLVSWDRSNNTSRFYPYYKSIDSLGKRALQIKSVCLDSMGRIWAGIYEGGVALLDPVSGRYRLVAAADDGPKQSALKSEYVHDLFTDHTGTIWASTGQGVFTINPRTFKIDSLLHNPVLNQLIGQKIWKIWADKANNLWFASQAAGIWHYNTGQNTIQHMTTLSGLPSNTCYSFAHDELGNIYISTNKGLAVLDPQGKIVTYSRSNGLKSDVCEALMEDQKGNIWIANHSFLICYYPQEKTFRYFNEKQGLSNQGFRLNAFYVSPADEMFLGNSRGLNYFVPGKLDTLPQKIRLNITGADWGDSLLHFHGNELLQFAYSHNNINFHFAAIDLTGSKQIAYRYILEGFDKRWIEGIDVTEAKYTSLPYGAYTFKVMASKDGVNWIAAQNDIRFEIQTPYWKQWWFYALLVLLAVGIFIMIAHRVNLRRKEKESMRLKYERKIASVEMNTLRAQMNPHFIFNSLNSINTFILQNDPDNATDYLSKFSRLVRLILDNSRSEWVPLENELKALQLYIELESIRFDNAFTYSMVVDPAIAHAKVLLPPLLIQPYVENAIWHGLMHRKTPGGRIDISIHKQNQDLLIRITDNGVGRKMAAALKGKKSELHKSHGMKITAERLGIVNEVYKMNATVTVSDLEEKEENGGTAVLLKIQYKTNAGNYRG